MDFRPEDQPFWHPDPDTTESLKLMAYAAIAGLSFAAVFIWILWGAR